MWNFRTIDGPGFKLTRDPRATRQGSFLLKTSIDELPPVRNVLEDSMSSNVLFAAWVRTDQEYLDRWSLWTDVRLLPATVIALWRQRGRGQ